MTRSLTVVIIIFVAALGAAIVYALLSPSARFHDTTPIAVVGGETITRGQVAQALWRGHAALGLKTLVDQRIVEQLAQERGLKPEPSRIEYLMGQEELRAGGAKQLDERLAKAGRTRADLEKDLAQQALAEQLMESEVHVSDAEIKAYYDAHKDEFRRGEMIKGRLMLLDTRANAQTIAEVLDYPGFDFAEWARQISVDPATKDEGGDMGWIERGDYAREITDAAFKLKPGQHTGIIEYPDGFAIVLVEAKKPAGHQSLDEVRGTVESLLHTEKKSALRFTWAAEQRKKANVTIGDEALRRAFEAVRGS